VARWGDVDGAVRPAIVAATGTRAAAAAAPALGGPRPRPRARLRRRFIRDAAVGILLQLGPCVALGPLVGAQPAELRIERVRELHVGQLGGFKGSGGCRAWSV